MKKLLAYLPCYNEAENIETLSRSWAQQAPTLLERGYALEILPIDDKSRDNTLEIIRRLETELPDYTVIAHKVNKGLGGALDTALRDFMSKSAPGDVMAFMDGDNTHDPVYVHSMLDALEGGADCVIASRYRKGAEIHGVPGHRVLLSDCARLYYTLMLGVPGVRDYTCGYRLYSHDCIARGRRKYGDGLVTMRSFSCMMELLYKLSLSSCRFAEVPFSLRYDSKGGESKMRVVQTMRDSLTTALRLRTQKNR